MSEQMAGFVWLGLAGYAALGGLVWLALAAGGFKRFDANAHSAPWRVKALLAPGIVALWPVMIGRAFGVRPQEDRV